MVCQDRGQETGDKGMSAVASLVLEGLNACILLGVTGGYCILQIQNSNDFTLNKVISYSKVI